MLLEWPYRTALAIYRAGIGIAAIRSTKAKQWVEGRAAQDLDKLNIPPKCIWVHCASLGEYEQGLPVIEALQEKYPSKAVLISFFSPSGYEVIKKRGTHKYLLYLPLDSPSNAKAFIDSIDPALVVFVKYEYWYYYLKQLHQRNIPTLLVSAIFRESSIHFKTWGALHRQMLKWFTHVFVQDQASAELIRPIVNGHVTVAGDTRFDRVLSIKNTPLDIPYIKDFCQSNTTIVAGSTWPDDEHLIVQHYRSNTGDYKLIIAPHEISEAHIRSLLDSLGGKAVKYSELTQTIPDHINVVIIDSIGKLSHLYKYGHLAYIGGGFGAGIHNTLEAAANGLPVVIGPKYQKFQEAIDLLSVDAAFSITDKQTYNSVLSDLLDSGKMKEAGIAAANYVNARAGATNTIIQYINNEAL